MSRHTPLLALFIVGVLVGIAGCESVTPPPTASPVLAHDNAITASTVQVKAGDLISTEDAILAELER
jgi:hypothetical protein